VTAPPAPPPAPAPKDRPRRSAPAAGRPRPRQRPVQSGEAQPKRGPRVAGTALANPWTAAGRRTPASRPPTSLENTARHALVRKGLTFQEQHQVGRYWPDFVLPGLTGPGFPLGVIVECDGEHYHGSVRAKAKDATKDRYYAQAGYLVVRWPGWDIQQDAGRLVRLLLERVARLREAQGPPGEPA
jgi:very-short-patch-repair endonuclease